MHRKSESEASRTAGTAELGSSWDQRNLSTAEAVQKPLGASAGLRFVLETSSSVAASLAMRTALRCTLER